jgi:hypothetical protein
LIFQKNIGLSSICCLGRLQVMMNMVSTNVVSFVGSQVVQWSQGHMVGIHPRTLIELARLLLSLFDRGLSPQESRVFCDGCRSGRRAPHCLSCSSLPAPTAPHDPWSGFRRPRLAGRSGRLLFGSAFSTRESFAVFSRARAQHEYAVARRHHHLMSRTVPTVS